MKIQENLQQVHWNVLQTARTKIDVYAGTLSMEFGDIIVHFNILDDINYLL